MIWTICLVISVIVLASALVGCCVVRKKAHTEQRISPFQLLLTGTFLAVWIAVVPVLVTMFRETPVWQVYTLFLSVIQTLQVFTINVGADFILDTIGQSPASVSTIYSCYMTLLFVMAPILTVSSVALLLSNVTTRLRLLLRCRDDWFVFSTLNEKSLLLAESIRQNHQRAVILFASVPAETDDADLLRKTVRSLDALLFSEEITAINCRRHADKARLTFLVVGEDESDNVLTALKLLQQHKNSTHTDLFVLSSGVEGELLLSHAGNDHMKVRRINEVRSLVYRFLYDEGFRLFESAVPAADGTKHITAAVVGLGQYGTEMLKALSWFCQMTGYSVELHAFDQDPAAEDKFAALCPELMSTMFNGVHIPGEGEYTIQIHAGMEVSTRSFAEAYMAIPAVSFVFVALGDDKENIVQAANIRMLSERSGSKPIIKTILHNAEEREALSSVTNYRGQPYAIESINGFAAANFEELMLGSDLEKIALERHLKWGKEDEFWNYEYNYRSSMASAIHSKVRILCGVPGADKPEDQRTIAERDGIEVLEHRRWNTYMRSEGYVYSGSPDRASRNDLGKMHHDLIPFELLSEEDKRKDK